jgi:hypothetical protein
MRTNRLVLAIPGLLPPAAAPASTEPAHTSNRSPPFLAPYLGRLLALAGAPPLETDGIDAALARVYGVDRQHDWPLAPVFANSVGVDPGTAYWLVASPVTLVVGRNEVSLSGAVTDIAADDAAALMTTLNAHFADDGLSFIAPRSDRWFVRSASVPALVTHPLSVALSKPLRELLPSGPDAGKWRRWQDEIQMLLHEHPVNVVRERRGEHPVNSLWFWGGGTRPPAHSAPVRTFANNETATALATYIGAPASALPADLDAVFAESAHAETIVVALDCSPEPDTLERAWMTLAWAALCSGAVALVTLITDADGGAALWTARHPSAWQRLMSRVRSPDARALLAAARATD